MPEAIGAMLQAHGGLYDKQLRREKKAIGTPGMPNRRLSERSEDREEQVNSDRLPARRGDNLAIPRCSEPLPRRTPSQHSGARLPANHSGARASGSNRPGTPWQALDQALRSTDLLLQGGGFHAIVLDLGNTPPEAALRIPLATWFRFRGACERSRASLILLTQHPCARSSAELVVRLQTGSMEVENSVMTGIRYQAITERSRSQKNVMPIRKPPQPERPDEWKSAAPWVPAL
jgi:recombination protein RecA